MKSYNLNKERKLTPKKNSDKKRLDFLETHPTILTDSSEYMLVFWRNVKVGS